LNRASPRSSCPGALELGSGMVLQCRNLQSLKRASADNSAVCFVWSLRVRPRCCLGVLELGIVVVLHDRNLVVDDGGKGTSMDLLMEDRPFIAADLLVFNGVFHVMHG